MNVNPLNQISTPPALCSSALMWSIDALKYNFGPDHPLTPIRMIMAVDLMRKSGILADDEIFAPPLASNADIRRAHRLGLIMAVQGADQQDDGWRSRALRYGLTFDTPAFIGMHEAGARSCGWSLSAAQMVHEGDVRHTFNPTGGHHHAHRDRAAGFCIYNDAVVAIKWLIAQGERVMYIDTDVHHGDGVQEAFYADDRVLTLSLHQHPATLYPGTGYANERGVGRGYGYSVNLPLEPHTDDAGYIATFDEVVPAVARAFQPSIIVMQCGADAHTRDPLAQLDLTATTYRHIYNRVHALSHELCAGKLVTLAGGGYDGYHAVPRIWTILWAELTGRALPALIPQSWRETWQVIAPRPLPYSFDDNDLHHAWDAPLAALLEDDLFFDILAHDDLFPADPFFGDDDFGRDIFTVEGDAIPDCQLALPLLDGRQAQPTALRFAALAAVVYNQIPTA